ncbi:MAG: PBP1A family penicillin-binding protein [Firmicutes bacterium]|nr:PBP1A family penicillin-binding protein [Bacillota bacterium]
MMVVRHRKAVLIALFLPLLFIAGALVFLIWGEVYAGRVLGGLSGSGGEPGVFARTSFVYAEDGTVAAELHGEIDRVPVPLEMVPEHVRAAFVAVEDERFYRHGGVDLKAVLRAAYQLGKSRRVTEGASTITQQVVKLYFLSPEQSLRRKIKEAALALELERRYSKDQILEFYLNRVYFGEGAYGIERAAKAYFNKEAAALDLPEGALLAALVQAPSAYDPYLNPEVAASRRNVVLEKMVRQGLVPEEAGREAQNSPLRLGGRVPEDHEGSFFIDYVIEEVIAAVGPEVYSRGGLKIYTTLEPVIQRKAEEVLARPGLFPSPEVETALAMVENGTGAIKALVGGRKYETGRGFNRATQLARQPGSAFKPIAVYAPAFEAGYGPDSLVSDAPFSAGGYEPRNSDGRYYGQISIRTALQWSRNSAAVWLLNRIGVDRGFEMAQKLGFDLVEEDRCLPLALGGLTKGVSPLQMAGAYAAFANRGVYIKPHAVKSIVGADGQELYRCPEGVAVMKPSTAGAVRDVLRTVVEAGTGYRAAVRGVPVAGKTGTVELPDTAEFRGLAGNKDAWFAGFTPRYTAAVWMGYDEKDMDRQHYLTSYGGNQPAEIFRLVMARVLNLDETQYNAVSPPEETETEQSVGEKSGAAGKNEGSSAKGPEEAKAKGPEEVKAPVTGEAAGNAAKEKKKPEAGTGGEAKQTPAAPSGPGKKP